MKRPYAQIDRARSRAISKEDRLDIIQWVDYLESRIQPVSVNETSTGDNAATKPRKTVSDAVDYFDGVWPDGNSAVCVTTGPKWSGGNEYAGTFDVAGEDFNEVYEIGDDSWVLVCTREEFEAEVARRKGEEWTHVRRSGQPCKVLYEDEDVQLVRSPGGTCAIYIRENYATKRKQPISKAEAWDKLVAEMENPKGKSVFSVFYDILEQFEVK